MNGYELQQEARRERLAAAAEKARAEARAAFDGANAMADIIPMGQPILVGHHSEKRDRRYRERITGKMRKGVELSRKADELERCAERVGTAGISSDDPNAIAKLRAELASLESAQERMKRANRFARRGDRAGLAALRFSDRQVDELLTPDYCGRIGFPGYATANNNANIRRVKQRIGDLEARSQTSATEPIVGDGWTISEDLDENRIIVRFDAKPSRELLSKLRENGFRWSPTRGAHVRMRSNGAIYAAKHALGVNA